MAKIKQLTPEQEAKIPEFIAKWVNMASKPTDRNKATKAVKDMYRSIDEKEPIVIFGLSPFSTAIMAAMFFGKNGGKHVKLDEQLNDQLDDQLRAHLRDQLFVHLSDRLDDQLHDQLDNQLFDKLFDQLNDQLFDQLNANLRTQLRDQLNDQLDVHLSYRLDNQLRTQLRDQLDDQLYANLRTQLRDRLNDQLNDQLLDRLDDQLFEQMSNQLHDQLYAHLGDRLDNQLRTQLYANLSDRLYVRLRDQLLDELDNQLRDQLDDQLLDRLDNQWSVPIWWLPWCSLYDYGQYIGVEFDKEQYDLFMSFVSNVGFIIPYRGIAFVSEAPTRIVWNAGRLHYDHGKAVEYKDGWGLYMLRGVRFDEEQYNAIVNEELTLKDLAKDKYKLNDDQRVVAIQMLRPDRLLKQVGAKLIDTSPFTGTRLYRVDDFMGTGETEYCIRMEHPSIEGREYIEWVDPEVGKVGRADYAQAVAFGVPEEDLYVVSVKA